MTRSFAVAVTGLGLISPAGVGVADNWARVLGGQPTAAVVPEFAGLPVDIACRVPECDLAAGLRRGKSWRLDRGTLLAVRAAAEAVDDAGLAPNSWDGTRVGVVLGAGAWGAATLEVQHSRLLEKGPGAVSPLTLPMSLPNMAAAQLAIEFNATGPSLTVVTACAAGTDAIGTARTLLRAGAADVILAGGVEAVVTRYFVTAFARMGALAAPGDDPARASRPFDVSRNGFVLAEAAGVLVLETEHHAHTRGATVRALVAGYGTTTDAYHVTAPRPDGGGAERAMRAALRDAGLPADEIDHVNAHGTSTRMNDVIEARAIRRVLGERPSVTSTKGVTGHALGAAGAIEAAYTVLTVQHGKVPPTANLRDPDPDIHLDLVTGQARTTKVHAALSNSFGFGGHNAVLAITAA
jgi:3-oxoacyl-[acyl-carrier-protein] synthase II